MRKCVDAFALIRDIKARADFSDCLVGVGLNEAVNMLESASAVEVSSETYAPWVSHITSRPPRPFEMATCDKCHKCYGEYSHWWEWNYCPNCGTKKTPVE